jgi:hypothetical protein
MVKFRAEKSGSATAIEVNLTNGDFKVRMADGAVLPITPQSNVVAAVAVGLGKVKKILSNVPSPFARLDMISALSNFSTVLAVDATPVGIGTGRSIVVVAQIFLESPTPRIEVRVVFDVQGIPSTINQERLGWKLVIEEVQAAIGYHADETILIITDHDLGAHDAINARIQEVLPGYLLPPGFTLGYGSDKSPSDSPTQAAIKLCDSFGKGWRDHPASVETPVTSAEFPFFSSAVRWTRAPDPEGKWDGVSWVATPVLPPSPAPP